MPRATNGRIIQNIADNGRILNNVVVNGNIVHGSATIIRQFTLADAGINFTVSQTTISLSLTTGSFVNTNYTNGEVLDTVAVDTPRTLTGSVRVPNNTSQWTNANQLVTISGISDDQEATIATTTSGPYTYGPVVVTEGGTFIIYGSFTDWAPENNPDTSVERIDQTRSRTQTERTTQTGTRTVTCDFDSCTGSSATSIDVDPVDVPLEDDVETRNIQNPLFANAPFTFRDVANSVSAAVFINEDGFIRATNTSGTDVAAVGAQISTSFEDAEGNAITASITSASFVSTATSGQNNQLLIGISVDTPTNFANSGTVANLSGRITEFYPEPVLNAPNLTVTVTAGIAPNEITASFNDNLRGNQFDIGGQTEYTITATNSGSPTLITGLGTFDRPGVNGRFHRIEAEIANVGSDTVTFRVTNDGSA